MVGGIIGYNRTGIIYNCYNKGTIQGNINIGGIVGAAGEQNYSAYTYN